MCKIVEDMLIEERRETTIAFVKKMLADGVLSLEKIAEYSGLSLDEVKRLRAEQP